jgi:hypothetical protein
MTDFTAPVQVRRSPGRRMLWLPLLLAVLALWDIRDDLQLLFDHPTVTAVIFLVRSHPLAVAVLLVQPSLWTRYR